MAQLKNKMLRADRTISKLFSGANAMPRPNGLGGQLAYAVAARRFLETTRIYLAIQYTGSRHWYPNCGMAKVAVEAAPPPCFLNKEKKHVVG